MHKTLIDLVCSVVVAACTKDGNKVGTASEAPVAYDSHSCPRLVEDAQRISSLAAQTVGVQDQNASIDKLAMAAGVIVFWRGISTPNGYDTQSAQLAKLKRDMDAIERASIQNKCDIAFRPAPPDVQPAVK